MPKAGANRHPDAAALLKSPAVGEAERQAQERQMQSDSRLREVGHAEVKRDRERQERQLEAKDASTRSASEDAGSGAVSKPHWLSCMQRTPRNNCGYRDGHRRDQDFTAKEMETYIKDIHWLVEKTLTMIRESEEKSVTTSEKFFGLLEHIQLQNQMESKAFAAVAPKCKEEIREAWVSGLRDMISASVHQAMKEIVQPLQDQLKKQGSVGTELHERSTESSKELLGEDIISNKQASMSLSSIRQEVSLSRQELRETIKESVESQKKELQARYADVDAVNAQRSDSMAVKIDKLSNSLTNRMETLKSLVSSTVVFPVAEGAASPIVIDANGGVLVEEPSQWRQRIGQKQERDLSRQVANSLDAKTVAESAWGPGYGPTGYDAEARQRVYDSQMPALLESYGSHCSHGSHCSADKLALLEAGPPREQTNTTAGSGGTFYSQDDEYGEYEKAEKKWHQAAKYTVRTTEEEEYLEEEFSKRHQDSEGYLEEQANAVAKAPKLKEDSSFAAVFLNDTSLDTHLYDVESLYKTTGLAQALARDDTFGGLANLMILVNAVYLGIDSDHNESANLYDADLFFIVGENLFCVWFTFEWLVRFFAFSRTIDAIRDGWMRFDAVLVGMMLLETWVLMPVLKAVGGSNPGLPVGPLRLLRLLKLTRMARMMNAFPELVTMVKGVARSLRAISGSFLLVVLLLYTFAILIHSLLKDDDEMNAKLQGKLQFEFSTMPHCMWTLFVLGVFMLDGAANVLTSLVFADRPTTVIAGWLFLLFTLLSAMTVLQMLIGELCMVISDTTKEREAAKTIAIVKQQLVEKLRAFDDGDGKISKAELTSLMRDPESKALLRSLGINRLFLLEMERLMFPSPDSAVAFKPLTEIMLMCRGDNSATVETMACGFSYLVGEVREAELRTSARVAKLEARMNS